jgi:transcriptional regulator with XRE-family HTH domain
MEKTPSSYPLTRSQATTADWEGRLGADLRRLRLRNRLTQTELAERANVSGSAIKSLEGGKGSSLTTVVRVVRALGRTDWLESLLPPEPAISPMEILRQRRRAETNAAKRVRHPSAKRGSP